MSIVIEEVVISIEVGSSSEPRKVARPNERTEDQQALVAECVERVLEILAQRQER